MWYVVLCEERRYSSHRGREGRRGERREGGTVKDCTVCRHRCSALRCAVFSTVSSRMEEREKKREETREERGKKSREREKREKR